jgi:hypothetical protein
MPTTLEALLRSEAGSWFCNFDSCAAVGFTVGFAAVVVVAADVDDEVLAVADATVAVAAAEPVPVAFCTMSTAWTEPGSGMARPFSPVASP